MSTIWRFRVSEFFKKLIKAIVVSFLLITLTRYGWQQTSHLFELDPSLQGMSERLRKIVSYLSEDIGTRNAFAYSSLDDTADYIERHFEGLGYGVEKWPYEVRGVKFHNLVAKLKRNDSEEYILIGAHYDSCFNPGADDNASGIAGVLELARGLRDEAVKANIMFVAFANEEPPFFQTDKMGSRVFVKDLQTKKVLVNRAIVFDMIGYYSDKAFSQTYPPLLGPFYPNRGNFIAVVGDFQSRDLVHSIERALKKTTSFPISSVVAPSTVPGLNFSDHASFWDAGIQAVMVTDTAYMRNPHYHRDSDRAETLDYKRMATVIEGVRQAVIKIANQ